jgi:flavodoxin
MLFFNLKYKYVKGHGRVSIGAGQGGSMNALIIYWSATGNTKRVAETIHNTLQSGGIDSLLKRVEDAKTEDLYEYDLVFIGTPTYQWQPPAPVLEYVKEKIDYYRERGFVKLCAPTLPGKKGVVFVTYSGPHTGTNEAIPVGKYLGQFFEHLGFAMSGEWYVVGEFHNFEDGNTKGRLGDIRGRPNQQDLDNIIKDVNKLLKTATG